MSDKVFENRLRRMAQRQGLVLEKSRRRDKRATDYGRYRLMADHRDLDNRDVQALPYTQTIDEIIGFLEGNDEHLTD
jgi:hypothetical protein